MTSSRCMLGEPHRRRSSRGTRVSPTILLQLDSDCRSGSTGSVPGCFVGDCTLHARFLPGHTYLSSTALIWQCNGNGGLSSVVYPQGSSLTFFNFLFLSYGIRRRTPMLLHFCIKRPRRKEIILLIPNRMLNRFLSG